MAGETQNSSSEDRLDRIEGMMIAHRKILGQLVAAHAQGDPGLLDRLDDRAVFHDGQEDPGAVPTDGVATGLSISEEVARVVSLARVEMNGEPD